LFLLPGIYQGSIHVGEEGDNPGKGFLHGVIVLVNCFPEVKVVDKLSGCASISSEDGWWVPFKSTIGRVGDDIDLLCFLSALSSSDVDFFLLCCHCGLDR